MGAPADEGNDATTDGAEEAATVDDPAAEAAAAEVAAAAACDAALDVRAPEGGMLRILTPPSDFTAVGGDSSDFTTGYCSSDAAEEEEPAALAFDPAPAATVLPPAPAAPAPDPVCPDEERNPPGDATKLMGVWAAGDMA